MQNKDLRGSSQEIRLCISVFDRQIYEENWV